MLYEEVPFDSALFGYKVAKFTCDTLSFQHLEASLDVMMKSEGVKLAYWWSNPDDLQSQLAARSLCGVYVGKKIRYLGLLAHIAEETIIRDIASPSIVTLSPFDKEKMSVDALLELSSDVFEHSRFNIDSKLTGNQCEKMFRTWITNSVALESNVADHLIVATLPDGKPAGFVSICMNPDATGRIPLFVVHKSWRQRGVGAALFASTLLWAKQQQLSSLTISMNDESHAPSILKRYGFQVAEHGAMWHFWLPYGAEGDDELLPNNRPFFTGHEIDYVGETLDEKHISSAGAFTKKCHDWLETYLRRPSSTTYKTLLVGSGTQALEMSAILAGVGHGDEVIMPSFTFVSTANAFVLRGCVPVFVDCRPDTLNIDETKIEAAITDKTKAIVVVHYAGIACEMDTIMDIAHRHNLVVIEDAAHAIMSYYKGRALGSIGDYGCFSFHYTKNLIAGECGALAINRPEHVHRAMIVWEKGTNRYDFLMGKVDKYAWVDVGSSFLPSEITASVLWAQFEEGYAIQAARTWVWNTYLQLLSPMANDGLIQIPALPDGTSPNGHIFWVLFRTEDELDKAQTLLRERGIQAFSHYVPLHKAPGGAKYGRIGSDMSVVDSIASRLLRMPIWPGLNVYHMNRVVKAIHEAIDV